MMRRSAVLLLLTTFSAGCEDEKVLKASDIPGGAKSAAPAGPQVAAAAAPTKPPENAIPAAVEFQEADFTETEKSRDPFRSFASMFSDQAKSKIKSQREVVLDQYSLDELKLVGIVTRIDPPRAMLVDPTGKGHVIRRGQFVGRPEIVQGGKSGADYEINWRVERIRDTDIVLVREDPANPDVPTATRVILLRPEETG
jgi:type IV pilus assembly protein PilP